MEKELVECALKRLWRESSVASVISLNHSPGATKYQGYLSTITRITMKVILGNGRTSTKSLVIKDAQVHDKQGVEFQKNYNVFKIETMMYDVVLKEMGYLMDEMEDTDGVLWCSLLYHVPYSCLVLEDLKATGFDMLDRNVFFDLDHSLLTVHSLGRYHGMCKVLEERGIISKSHYKQWFVFDDKDMHRLWFWNTKALVQGVKKYWDDSWASHVNKIKLTPEGLHKKLRNLGELDETKFNILNHGDCHKNNIMFKHDWKGTPIDLRFLDFQIPHYGSPCCDLTFLLYLGVDPDVRRQHFSQLLQAYHRALMRTLDKYQFDGSRPVLSEIVQDMEKFSFVGLFIALFGFPGMFISKDIDLFSDFEKVDAQEGEQEYNLDLYKSESFKKSLGPDILAFVDKFCDDK